MAAWLTDVFAERSVLEVACGNGYWTQFYEVHSTVLLQASGGHTFHWLELIRS
jgi:hypothetical protein